MNVVFRADASVAMGTGHLMRCLNLALALRQRGCDVSFISRDHPGHLGALLRKHSIPVTLLPAAAVTANPDDEDYGAWLGVTQAVDAGQTIEAIADANVDWLVVDHYGLDAEWQRALRPLAGALMVVDDLANRCHECDLLLDQNYSAKIGNRYQNLLPDGCEQLLGPRYALLGREYRAYRNTLPEYASRVKRALIFFGGTDPHNLTAIALEALSDADLQHLQVDVVIGANNPHAAVIERQVSLRPNTTLHQSRPHLADLMVQADLAIGAGGTTTWERMCLGLPAVVVTIADNQRPAAKALQDAGMIHYAGHHAAVSTASLKQLLLQVCGDAAELSDLSLQGRLEVDGLGVMRVAEVLFASAVSDVRLRPATAEDNILSFNLRCDQQGAHGGQVASACSWGEHQAWFCQQLQRSGNHLFIVESTSLPLGQIALARGDEATAIEYSLDAIVRKRGWEAQLIRATSQLLARAEPRRLGAIDCDAADPAYVCMANSNPADATRADQRFYIAVLSDATSWINDYLAQLVFDWIGDGHRLLWVHDRAQLRPGDFCFYLSYGDIVPADTLARFRHNLVVHESDLPCGKGWSPLTWQVLEGANSVPVCLFEASEQVDGGDIYARDVLEFEGHELVVELRAAQAAATIELCQQFVRRYPQILDNARAQQGEESFYPRRRPQDSRLNPTLPIESQFELLRVADNNRYPGFFEFRGHRYALKIEKVKTT